MVVQVLRSEEAPFVRGDADARGSVNIADAIYTLRHLFLGGPAPECVDAADADDNGGVQISDPVYSLNWLFRGASAPPAPGTDECGADPTEDELECVTYSGCDR